VVPRTATKYTELLSFDQYVHLQNFYLRQSRKNDQQSKCAMRLFLLLSLCCAMSACNAGFHASLPDATPPVPTTQKTARDVSFGLNGEHGIEAEVLRRVNAQSAIGAICGTTIYAAAAPLTWNSQLMHATRDHSSDMAQNNFFSHDSLDGTTAPQRIKAAGYSSAFVGENIGAGQPRMESVVAHWMHSTDHCKNLMNPKFRNVAVACARNDTATHRVYWTMDLGRN
jgi:uncharacterized protein YkwD